MREMRDVHNILAKKLHRKSWWNNTGRIACENMEYVQLTEDRVKTVMKF
jgi:hypothetical protein